jgi:SPP1 gp7 family putative phage head morphogenesis protein
VSANDDVADAITAHSIDLSRFAEDLVARVMPVLSRVERSLVADVAEIDPTAGTTLSNRQRRLKLLLEQTRGTISTAYRDIADTVGSDLRDVAKISDKAGRKIVNDAVGVEIQTVAIAPEQLRALADGTLVQGAIVKEHWSRQSVDLTEKFSDRVQQGYMRGEPSTEIVNRVRGTKARGYADGLMVGTKNSAGALVRTSVQTVSNAARLESFKANADILRGVQWVSTLDNRTTVICRARSGLMWDLDGNPIDHDIPLIGPPAHWNCRSTLVVVLKSWSEVSSKKDFDLPDGGKGTPPELVMAKSSKRQGAEAIESMQASMDGHVSADLDYESWLRTKPVEFQLDVLGPTKHKLWTAGKITFRDLVDQRGNPLTLAEIIAKVESGQTTAARGETMRKAKEAAATVDDLEKTASAAEKDARTQINRAVRAGYVTDDERDALKRYTAARTAGDEPDLDAVQAYDARPEWLQDRITAAVDARREALKAKQQAGPAAEYAARKAVAESAQRLKATLHDPESIAEWVPGQITDAELNDVPFQPWNPPDSYNWLNAPGRKSRLPEPPMPQMPGKRQSAAVMMLEDDGRSWVYRLSAGLLAGLAAAATDGDDEGEEEVPIVHAVPSGALEAGMDPQAIAIREAWETLGLRAEIIAYLGDYPKPSSITRYYVARRTGGAPWRMGYESQSVKLVPLDMLPAIATDDTDKAVAHDLAALYRKAILTGNGDLAAGLASIIAQANALTTTAAKRKASLLREWVTQTAKGEQPSAAARTTYAALSGDEKAAYAALAKEKAGS